MNSTRGRTRFERMNRLLSFFYLPAARGVSDTIRVVEGIGWQNPLCQKV